MECFSFQYHQNAVVTIMDTVVEVEVTLRPTASQSVCLSVESTLVLIFLLFFANLQSTLQ
jgi:hypothetical protein